MSAISIRFRVDFDGSCSVGFGKVALLDAIAQAGSLSQAARDMGMSYRRAWLLVDSMNKSFDRQVVTMSIGGKAGGGATLTDFGNKLVESLRTLELKLTGPAQEHLLDISRHVVKNKRLAAKKKSERRSIVKRR